MQNNKTISKTMETVLMKTENPTVYYHDKIVIMQPRKSVPIYTPRRNENKCLIKHTNKISQIQS